MKLPPFDGHATDVETLEVLFSLIRLTKPAICAEAGTYRGHGAIFMAHALEKNGSGVLHTADPYDHGQADTLGPYERVHFWETDYLEMLETMGNVDFAFIDASDWDETGARLRSVHFEATKAKISPGGLICVHDTAGEGWSDGEWGRSVRRIRDTCQLNLRAGRGLSIYHEPK